VGWTTEDGVVRVDLRCFPLAIQYPGRHDRRREPFVDQISVMSKSIGGALVNPVADKGFALFDRSMGAVLTVQVRHKLDSEHGQTPDLLPASGRRVPSRVRPQPGTQPSRLSDPESLSEFSPVARNGRSAATPVRPACRPRARRRRSSAAMIPMWGRESSGVGHATGPFY
jgi:pyochelin biosynthesis protein PchC